MTGLLEREEELNCAPANCKRYLFAHWEGGGNTPPTLAVARKLIDQGHEVRIISDPCNRDEVDAIGASFASWERAPARKDKSPQSDPMRDWEVKSPPALLRRLCDHLFVGTALARARDVQAQLEQFPADVIVTSEMLLGVMAAAEAAKIPCVALAANVYLFPLAGVPPFGPGFQPAKTFLGRLRDKFVAAMTRKVFGEYTVALNNARKALGLDALTHPFDQVGRVDRVLVLTSPAFDFPSTRLPANVIYGGPEIGDPHWVEPWQSPWPEKDIRPLVLVGFSTTFQDQTAVLSRVVAALGTLDIRAVVTTGPAVDIDKLPVASNVHICRSAPHNQLLSEASAVITHCGHGTVIRALAAGVPMVCMPMGRDQNDNAARVVAREAGVRINAKSSIGTIRRAVIEVLEEPTYHQGAQKLATHIAQEVRESRTLEILESLAGARSGAR